MDFKVIGVDGQGGGGSPAAPGARAVSGWPQQFVTLAPPSLAALPGELDERGVRHGEPQPFPPGEPMYTTVDLPDLGSDALTVQFCAYPEGPRTGMVPPGDLAGVQEVERVVVGARDAGRARERWAALLVPGEEDPGPAWQPGFGPAVEVRPAGDDAVVELVIRVRSLPMARAAFTAAGLAVSGDNVQLGTLPARLVTG